MRALLVLLPAATLAVAAPAPSVADDGPIVRAAPALAEIGPQPSGSRLVRLPSLEFDIRIRPRCGRDNRIRSVSISIADTQQTYSAADFTATTTLAATLSLHQRQIGPLAIGRFCSAATEHTGTERVLRIPDALTANVSLRCASDGHEAVVYETLPLEIRLSCRRGETRSRDAHESSSSLTRF